MEINQKIESGTINNNSVMKRKIYLLAVVAFFCQFIYAEYAIIDRIVYDMNLDDLTATVLNFQVDIDYPCSVIIPGRVLYKNDIYKVTRMRHGYFSKYDYEFGYKYDEARANIEYIDLPNTLEEIEKGAFAGMRRLKALIIPASVNRFKYVAIWDLLGGGSFQTYPRLETITILGTPTCEKGMGKDEQEISIAAQIENEEIDYIKMMAYIVARVDSLTGRSELCPNLKIFSMPKAKAIIDLATKNKIKCAFFNEELQKACAYYNSKLKENAFYNGTVLTYEKVKLNQNTDIMRDTFYKERSNLMKKYKDLNEGKMEMSLRYYKKGKYIQCYSIAHPDKKAFIDSLLLELRCYDESEYNDAIIDAIDGKSITLTSCRDEQYQEYYYFFKDRNEFDVRYNLATSNEAFTNEIEERQKANDNLKNMKEKLLDDPLVSFQGILSKEDHASRYFSGVLLFFKGKYYYDDAINAVLTLNKKAKKEYEKNGQYFASPKEFFEAYISSQYKAELKKHKQQVK